ncbi:MAG: hypothetical protein ACHREM_32095, partial [Polyangiales bacterium]
SLMNFFYCPDTRADRLSILASAWDYVVLIEDPAWASQFPEFHFEGVRTLSDAIRAQGARPLLVMSWQSTTTATAAAGELAYRVGNGTGTAVVPAGYAWSAVSATAPPDTIDYSVAASLYTAVTGKPTDPTVSPPPSLSPSIASSITASAYASATAEVTKTHYTTPFVGAVRTSTLPTGASLEFMTSGTSSEALYTARMIEIAAKVGLASPNVAIGSTRPDKEFDDACLTNAASDFAAAQYRILFARGYVIDAAKIQSTGKQTDLQVQVWDRHWDTDPADGLATVEELEWASDEIYGQATSLGLVMIPYHLMFAKLKTAEPTATLTSDGVHATYPVSYGLAIMSLVSRTGLSVPTTGLDALTTRASGFAEETIRQLSTLSVSGAFVADDPGTRPTAR